MCTRDRKEFLHSHKEGNAREGFVESAKNVHACAPMSAFWIYSTERRNDHVQQQGTQRLDV